MLKKIGTSETPEDQAPVEESPVVFEPAQTEASPEEVSPLADETETEPLEEVKIEAEETENGEEADEIDVQNWKKSHRLPLHHLTLS